MKPITAKLSWPKKLMFASLTTVLFFLALEAILALVGVRSVTESDDPFVGFSSRIPLMELDESDTDNPILRTAKAKLVWFNPQSFPAKKAPGTRRVFCLGGSTTFGRPFSDVTSYCGWLRELLPLVDSSARWEVINAGGVSYASYRVASVMRELAPYQGDLFIVYSAHNEFLERRTYEGMFEQPEWRRDVMAALQKTRTWSIIDRVVGRATPTPDLGPQQLPGEVDEMLNHSIGPSDYHRDDVWHDKVMGHYRWNLAQMVSIARRSGAEVVFITPASNLRDCWPFKSELARDLDEVTRIELTRQLKQARTLLDQKQFDSSLAACMEVLSVDPRHAEAHYHAGRALFGLGRFAEAESAFQRAIDDDVCPLRATTRIAEAIRNAAHKANAPLVDFHHRLGIKSQAEQGHRCFGGEYFLDHVHPTIEIHRELALWTIDELQKRSLVQGAAPSEEALAKVQTRIDEQIDTTAQAVAYRNLAKVLHWAGKFHEAEPRARDAIALMPHDLESRFVLADCLVNMGRREEALDEYTNLFTIDEYIRAYLPYGELLAQRGDLGSAKAYLMQALMTENRENQARAHYMLGLVHLKLGEYLFAVESLQAADKLYPDNVATLMRLAEAQVANRDEASAIESLRRATELDSDSFEAHYRLGLVYLSQAQLDAARRHVEIAIKIRPGDAQASEALDAIESLESQSAAK